MNHTFQEEYRIVFDKDIQMPKMERLKEFVEKPGADWNYFMRQLEEAFTKMDIEMPVRLKDYENGYFNNEFRIFGKNGNYIGKMDFRPACSWEDMPMLNFEIQNEQGEGYSFYYGETINEGIKMFMLTRSVGGSTIKRQRVTAFYQGNYTLYQRFFHDVPEECKEVGHFVQVKLYYCDRASIKSSVDKQFFDFLETLDYPCNAEDIGKSLKRISGSKNRMLVSVKNEVEFGLEIKIESEKHFAC